MRDLNLAAGEAQIRQALELDPNDSWALSWSGFVAMFRGDIDAAVDRMTRAVAADPMNANRYADLSWAYQVQGRFDLAKACDRRIVELDPGDDSQYGSEALVELGLGHPEQALAALDRDPDEKRRATNTIRISVLDALGRHAEADALLATLEANHAQDMPYDLAEVHARRGQIDKAFAGIERSYARHDWRVMAVKVDPDMKNLQKDARFASLLHRLHISE